MIIELTLANFILALIILLVILSRKNAPTKQDAAIEKIKNEIEKEFHVERIPKMEEEPTLKDTEIFYTSKNSKKYHEKGCLALKKVKKKIAGTREELEAKKKRACPICMPSEAD